jgi:hypothetical protein
MAIYNNDKDPNDIQWEQEQMEIQILEPRRKFEQWWEQNKERILAEDQLNTNMKKYQIYYRAWIPSYGDIDHDDIIIEAVDEQSAISKFHELVKFVNRYEIKEIK